MSFYTVKRSLISFVYPNRCPFCGKVIEAGEFFCGISESCDELDYFPNEYNNADTFACIYNDKSKKLLTKAKENADGYAISAAAKLLHDTLVRNNTLHKIDIITAIPARKAAKRQRGYSFPALLAREIAGISGKQYCGRMLVLLRETEEQKELSAAERAENLKGAFGVRKPPKDLNVLVVDDVCTTGATLNEARRALKEHAKAVYIAAFAKTM
jgi:ComF family protein